MNNEQLLFYSALRHSSFIIALILSLLSILFEFRFV
jgi:hypothetical protein